MPPQLHVNLPISLGSPLGSFANAVYFLTNQPYVFWHDALKSLSGDSFRFLIRLLGQMDTITTRVLVERVSRCTVAGNLTELKSILDPAVILKAWQDDPARPVLVAL